MEARHLLSLRGVMPETELIPRLIREAPARVEEMMKRQAKVNSPAGRTPKGATTRIPASETNPDNCPTGTSAAEFIPHTTSLPVLREAAQNCRGCQIYCNATQAVFGEGPRDATVMFVGEQPGDQEDKAGKPFVGPAGQMLNDALAAAGVPRDEAYVTNAVKHFKWEPRGTRRLHSKPSAREVSACRPWLETEIKIIQPRMIVCLGATAAQSLMGPAFRITKQRGKPITGTKWAPWVMATVHPSSILRIPERDLREQAIEDFVNDLKVVARQLRAAASAPRERGSGKGPESDSKDAMPSLFGEEAQTPVRRHRP
jgi:DNA polymerase